MTEHCKSGCSHRLCNCTPKASKLLSMTTGRTQAGIIFVPGNALFLAQKVNIQAFNQFVAEKAQYFCHKLLDLSTSNYSGKQCHIMVVWLHIAGWGFLTPQVSHSSLLSLPLLMGGRGGRRGERRERGWFPDNLPCGELSSPAGLPTTPAT